MAFGKDFAADPVHDLVRVSTRQDHPNRGAVYWYCTCGVQGRRTMANRTVVRSDLEQLGKAAQKQHAANMKRIRENAKRAHVPSGTGWPK